ncbi:MAG: helix-turn-helix transcriptional regulator [Acidobacteria bacterium]|nr:helix-turn-helix transcriptional regulator [Acidobacteriota bacterium]MYK89300.1 helix-turn-helix transcriptional regulator [Acidobacteriota bacterium]
MGAQIEQIVRSLRDARQAKGLSQRELSVSAVVPQGHISKIENATVDLRVSSLVALARALDLELMLVPRGSVAAVRSISAGAGTVATHDGKGARRVRRELARLQDALDHLPASVSSGTELAELLRLVRDLRRFRPAFLDPPTIRRAVRAVDTLLRKPVAVDAVRRSVSELRTLRDALAHGRVPDEVAAVRPAYSLDDDDG